MKLNSLYNLIPFAIAIMFIYFLLFFKKEKDIYRNVYLNGVVVQKKINSAKFEKTSTVVLNNGIEFVLPNIEIDMTVEVGDSIFKDSLDSRLIIFKRKNDSIKERNIFYLSN